MKKTFAATIRVEGKITIPIEIRKQLLLVPGDLVELTIKKPDWWELLDWSEMKQTFDILPLEIKNKIRAKQDQTSEEKPT